MFKCEPLSFGKEGGIHAGLLQALTQSHVVSTSPHVKEMLTRSGVQNGLSPSRMKWAVTSQCVPDAGDDQ